MRRTKTCIHCDPYTNDSLHIPEKIDKFFSNFSLLLKPVDLFLDRYPGLNSSLYRIVIGGFFKFQYSLGILKEVEITDSDDDIPSRSLVIVREARSRNIVVNSLFFCGKRTNFFTITYNGKKNIFEGLPYVIAWKNTITHFDDKGKLKASLEKAEVPHPLGRTFRNYVDALHYVRTSLKFPLVVKPSCGSLSKHTTCNIRTENELADAVAIAKIISNEFVVEEYIEGGVYRVTMIDGVVVASCLREAPHVIGDSIHTISELIQAKNNSPYRGMPHQRNYTLHKLQVSKKTHQLLASEQMSLQSILPCGKKMYIHNKVILACGADIHDTTDVMHPDNIILFEKVYALCGFPVIGIDFIIPDITAPYHKQKCAILEVNSLPYIDMHHYPVTGKPRNVAGKILDYYLKRVV